MENADDVVTVLLHKLLKEVAFFHAVLATTWGPKSGCSQAMPNLGFIYIYVYIYICGS